jgi:hypothetical protein
MKIISTRIHGILDYLFGLSLIISPFYLNINDNSPATAVLIFSGIITICYSTVTAYEFGFVPLLSMRVHLIVDLLLSLFLLASPWLCGFRYQVFLPHIIFGIIGLAVVSISQTIPVTENRFH